MLEGPPKQNTVKNEGDNLDSRGIQYLILTLRQLIKEKRQKNKKYQDEDKKKEIFDLVEKVKELVEKYKAKRQEEKEKKEAAKLAKGEKSEYISPKEEEEIRKELGGEFTQGNITGSGKVSRWDRNKGKKK